MLLLRYRHKAKKSFVHYNTKQGMFAKYGKKYYNN